MPRVLLSQAKIQSRVRQLGRTITRHYHGKSPLFLGVMNGALFFLADLLRAVDLETEVTSVHLTSYAGRKSTGKLRGLESLGDSFRGRHVVVVDDIFETGLTLSTVVARLHALGAADVKTCILLEKKVPRKISLKPDWVGFKIDDEFVIGYGLDFNGRYRGLKQICVLDPSAR